MKQISDDIFEFFQIQSAITIWVRFLWRNVSLNLMTMTKKLFTVCPKQTSPNKQPLFCTGRQSNYSHPYFNLELYNIYLSTTKTVTKMCLNCHLITSWQWPVNKKSPFFIGKDHKTWFVHVHVSWLC